MAKRKQPTVENIIDTAKKACVNEESRGDLESLVKNSDCQVLEQVLSKTTANESEAALEVLNSAFSIDEAFTSALIELAKKGDLNEIIKLANTDDFGDAEWLLETALDKAKKDNLPQDIIDILSRAVNENKGTEGDEGDEGDMQALGNSPDEYAQAV